MTKINVVRILSLVVWTLSLTALLFQCYWPVLANFLVPTLLFYIMLNVRSIHKEPSRRWLKVFCVYGSYIIISAILEMFSTNNIGNAIRFVTILLFIPFALLEDIKGFKKEWDILKILMSLKAITIILIWIIVFVEQDYSKWRAWAVSLGSGDIYILYGIPRVQILGNSLLPIIGIIDIERSKRFNLFNILMLIGSICAGNSAFILGLFIYFVIVLIKKVVSNSYLNNHNEILIMVGLLVMIVIFSVYSVNQIELKATGTENTNRVRIEQAEFLLSGNPIYGEGVGAYANGSISTRKYVNEKYFELQSLYIFYQIGILGMGMFLYLTVLPLKYYKNATLLYFIYLAYTFWNPYCFDSTHILVMLILNNYIGVDKKNGKSYSNCDSLLSRRESC